MNIAFIVAASLLLASLPSLAMCDLQDETRSSTTSQYTLISSETYDIADDVPKGKIGSLQEVAGNMYVIREANSKWPTDRAYYQLNHSILY